MGLILVVIGLVLAVGPSVSAAPGDGPWATRQAETNQPQINFLGQANQVFGYRFEPVVDGRITSLSGRFSGAKTVVLANVNRDVLATRTVTGNVYAWSGTSLPNGGVAVKAGQSYIVAVRVDRNWSSSLVWGVPLPFVRRDIRVLNAVAGESTSTNPTTWIRSIQPNTQPMFRGMVDVEFTPDQGNGDPHPQTPGVIDSFGESAPVGTLGGGWGAVDEYYAENPRRPGECSKEVHNRYWVQGADGRIHPTWHPPRDVFSGCAFGHEHGDDPRSSNLYRFSQGIPFAMTRNAAAIGNRVEDHVGHKITVQNDWGLVNGNPQNLNPDGTGEVITRSGIRCDWLSKVHQGSHSADALMNNGHEYFLNQSCTDGVQLRIKALLTWGPSTYAGGSQVEKDATFPKPDSRQSVVTNLCSQGGTELFDVGFRPTMPIAQAGDLDGKREFACLTDLLRSDPVLPRFEELWKSDGIITLPSGGWINFSPYYVVLNPARYIDDQWRSRGLANGFISTVNLCFNDNSTSLNRPRPALCDQVPSAVGDAAPTDRIKHPLNPMNGTRRVIHPKTVVLNTTSVPGTGTIRFCTNALGRNARLLTGAGGCQPGEVEQLVSRSDRRNWNQNGSDVGATVDAQGRLRGAGYLNEWTRNYPDPSIRFPN